MWVRDYRPNAICKWTKAVIESVDGSLNYIPCLHYMGTYLNQTVPMPDFEASTDLHFSLRNGTFTVRRLFML